MNQQEQAVSPRPSWIVLKQEELGQKINLASTKEHADVFIKELEDRVGKISVVFHREITVLKCKYPYVFEEKKRSGLWALAQLILPTEETLDILLEELLNTRNRAPVVEFKDEDMYDNVQRFVDWTSENENVLKFLLAAFSQKFGSEWSSCVMKNLKENHLFLSEKYMKNLQELAKRSKVLKQYKENSRKSMPVDDEYTCPVCFEVFYKPYRLSCSHRLCNICTLRLQQTKSLKKCPICRDTIRKHEMQYDKILNRFVATVYRKQYLSRAKDFDFSYDHRYDEVVRKRTKHIVIQPR